MNDGKQKAVGGTVRKPHFIPHRWARKVIELRHLILIAAPVGILAGAGVSLLEYICNRLLWEHLSEQALLLRLSFPILGLLISGWILHRLKVSSVGMLNEVVLHYHSPPESLMLKEDGLKALACISTVGLGASLGLGGPSQWLGTRIALYFRHYFGRYRPLRGITKSHIVLIGAAAGVSAIFRAPLAGTLLALETPFSKDIEGPVLFPASIAAFFSHFVHGYFFDNHPLLPFPSEVHVNLLTAGTALIVGLAAGFISRRFQRGLTYFKKRLVTWEWYYRALVGGAITSLTAAIAFHYFGDTLTLQAGLPLATKAFAGEMIGWTALALLILKIIAVWATASTTGVAGLLVVTLTVGSLIGATIQPLFGVLDPAAASAIGVCAYLAANYNAPLTGIALSAEWGGTGLLPVAWFSVIIAAWIGEGLANTPAKIRSRRNHKNLKEEPPILLNTPDEEKLDD